MGAFKQNLPKIELRLKKAMWGKNHVLVEVVRISEMMLVL